MVGLENQAPQGESQLKRLHEPHPGQMWPAPRCIFKLAQVPCTDLNSFFWHKLNEKKLL